MKPSPRFVASVLSLCLSVVACRDDSDSPAGPSATASQVEPAAAAALVFRQISAGNAHTCGVTTDDRAYCWGDGFPGKAGVGSDPPEFCMDWDNCITRPVAVLGSQRFRVVSAGRETTCGVTTADRAYCWGSNSGGTLGIGTATGPDICAGNESNVPCSGVPTAVVGGLHFRGVSVGGAHACGITTDGLAYCWGWNGSGQLGDGTTTMRTKPKAVAGGRHFLGISAGSAHTCGLTTDNVAYCWGYNASGQLGDSTRAMRTSPVRVAGGRRFRQLDSGVDHTCAVATSGRGFCWGYNFSGQLGEGTHNSRLAPTAVGGGLLFAQLTAGGSHACGRTAAG
ncbi:MAG TPA: hypothetical protein VH764_00005, partial [Gemmatimonadales bacterium]